MAKCNVGRRLWYYGVGIVCLIAPSVSHSRHFEDEKTERGLYDYSCWQLYLARNKFFHEKGLCFTRATAIRVFGNYGCQYRDSDDMPMTAKETRIMKTIVSVERDKSCPRY
jgi:hypothetical protein